MDPPYILSRRDFLAATTATAATLGLGGLLPAMDDRALSTRHAKIIDTHVSLGRWPFKRLAHEQAGELVEILRERQVTAAWVGSFEGLLHKDVAGANARLFEACRKRRDGMLIPFGSINPTLPDWEEDVRRCHEDFRMPGIRLHPNYHGYSLDDERFTRLLDLAAARKLVVQVVAALDEETHSPFALPTARGDVAPLAEQVRRAAGMRLVLSNGIIAKNETWLPDLVALENVYFDFAKLNAVSELNELLKIVPAERLVFGSGSPLGDYDAVVAALEGASLSEDDSRAIRHGTADHMVRLGAE